MNALREHYWAKLLYNPEEIELLILGLWDFVIWPEGLSSKFILKEIPISQNFSISNQDSVKRNELWIYNL